MSDLEPKKVLPIQEYQLSISEKKRILIKNFKLGVPLTETLNIIKFEKVDEFVNRVVYSYDRKMEHDFLFTLQLQVEEVEYLKLFLLKYKKFIYNCVTTKDEFFNSHIFQLFLQYIPNELTEVEKSVFLDAYIKMLTELRGNAFSCQTRRILEKKLNINQN